MKIVSIYPTRISFCSHLLFKKKYRSLLLFLLILYLFLFISRKENFKRYIRFSIFWRSFKKSNIKVNTYWNTSNSWCKSNIFFSNFIFEEIYDYTKKFRMDGGKPSFSLVDIYKKKKKFILNKTILRKSLNLSWKVIVQFLIFHSIFLSWIWRLFLGK